RRDLLRPDGRQVGTWPVRAGTLMSTASTHHKPLSGISGNARVALILVAVVAGMVGLSYAAVPLYQIFCQVTGYGGTTQVASSNLKGTIAREMTTRFDATVSSGLPISVRPARPVTDPIGNSHP